MTKQIKLETREIMMSTRDESGKVKDLPYKFDFRTELQLIMEAPSPRGDGGTTPGDMFKRLSIIAKLKAAEDEKVLLLDDDEYQLLSGDVAHTKFRIIDEAITDLFTAVDKAEDVKIKEVEAKEA